MSVSGNYDNMWVKPRKLQVCLSDRMKYFGSLEGYIDFLNDFVSYCGESIETAIDMGSGVAIPTISLVDQGVISSLDLLDKHAANLEVNRGIINDNYPHLKDKIGFIAADLYDDFFCEKQYDLVLALTVAAKSELKPNSRKIENVCSSVKPGGYLLMSVPLKANGNIFDLNTKITTFDLINNLMEHYDIDWYKSCHNDIEIWCLGQKCV
ncbi:MAG: hypothetical protein U9O53_03735 [archaeon]|nr:hypothetical protein [archaeon]